MEDSIYRISWMSVCSTTACLFPRRDWCLWKMYWKDNPQCYFLCQVKEFTAFSFSSQKGAALNFRVKLEHWELGPPHSLWWSKSHLRQFREMPGKLPSFWDNKSRWKTAKMAQVCGIYVALEKKKIRFNWLFASHVLVLSKPLLVFQGFKSENKPFWIYL